MSTGFKPGGFFFFARTASAKKRGQVFKTVKFELFWGGIVGAANAVAVISPTRHDKNDREKFKNGGLADLTPVWFRLRKNLSAYPADSQ